jgi:hypothetical protein
MKFLGKSFYGFRSRRGYLGESLLYLLLSWAWVQERFQYIVFSRVSFEQHMGDTLAFALAVVCTLRWTMGAWQRIYSMGLPTAAVFAWSPALTILWVWFITTPAHRLLVFTLFFAAQLPLLLFPMKADRTGTAMGLASHP